MEQPELEEGSAADGADAAVAVEDLPGVREHLAPIDPSQLELRETTICLNRVAKVVKGGRNFTFAACMVVGDGRGHVGVGFGKAKEVPDAIQKAISSAKKNMIRVPMVGRTVPYEVMGLFGASKVMVKPAAEGTGIIAGPAARAVLEYAGVRDVLTKSLGSANQMNVAKATLEALRSMGNAEIIVRRRGKTLEEVLGQKGAERYRAGRQEALHMKAEVQAQTQRQEKTRRGTYTAGGRDDDEEESGGAPKA